MNTYFVRSGHYPIFRVQRLCKQLTLLFRWRLIDVWSKIVTLCSFQAAYIAKLHQQAASIKNLLKLLSAGEAGLSNPGDLPAAVNNGSFENVSENISNNVNSAKIAQSGSSANAEESVYESLWEIGSRVNEVQDSGEDDACASQAQVEVRTCVS